MSLASTCTDTGLFSGTGYGVTDTTSSTTSGPSATVASPPSGTDRISAHDLPSVVSTAGDVTHRLAPFSIRYTLGLESSLRRQPSGRSQSRRAAVPAVVSRVVIRMKTWGSGVTNWSPAPNWPQIVGCR